MTLAPLQLPRPAGAGPLVGAHRGAMLVAPENTGAAFDEAVRLGAALIELDAHPTRDGCLAVLHDVTTARTTGRDLALMDLSLEELGRLDAGSWFDPRFAGQRIPSLVDVLHWAEGRAYVNIDVRNYPFVPFYELERTADILLGALEETGAHDRVVVQCLDHLLARELHRRRPDLVVGITQHGRPADLVGMAAAAGARLVGLDAAFLTAPMVDGLHAAGIAAMTSVELRLPGHRQDSGVTRTVISRLMDLGVDVLVGDDVEATARTVAELTEPDPAPV